MKINGIFSASALNTLQLCGIEHTCFRETKRLATAEAQMETLKGQRRCHNVSTSLIYQSAALFRTEFSLFLYGTFEFARPVQDLRFSCTKCSRFAIPGQVCPLDLLVFQESCCFEQAWPLNLLVPYKKEPFLSETSGLGHFQKVRHFCLPFRSFRKVYTFQEFFVGKNHSLCIEILLKARWLRG